MSNTEKILSKMKNPKVAICNYCSTIKFISKDYYDKIVEIRGYYHCSKCKVGEFTLLK